MPGPEIRVPQGGRLRVVLENRLEEETTVHWHGVRVPNAMDGVPHLTQPSVRPGERFVYEFDLPDAGTFWYHPHARSFEQVGRGLAGALIVEEPEPVAVDRDLTWLLGDWRLDREAELTADFGNLHDVSHAGRLGNPAAPVGGNPAGDVTLVEFFDYNCPYCRRVAPTVAEIVGDDPDLRVVYKEFPILGPGSTFAARAALAAQRQGRYAPFHEALMHAQGNLDERRVLEIARSAGLDLEQLREAMRDPAIDRAIQRNLELAAALGITGTPSFVVGDQIIPGAVDRGTIEDLIAHVRQSE